MNGIGERKKQIPIFQTEQLYDIRNLLDSLGFEQPLADIQLVDNSFIQCANFNDSFD